MKKLLFVTTVLFLSCAFSPQKKTKIIFFGDSITELGVKEKPYRGYILELEDKSKAENKSDQYDFIGSGISANKVYDLYLRLEDDVLSKNPDVVFIYVGVNDVWHKTLLGTGTDADKFEKFYLAILKKLKDKNIKAVLVTPAVVGEKTDMSNPLDGDLNKYCNTSGILLRRMICLLLIYEKNLVTTTKQITQTTKKKIFLLMIKCT